MRELKEENRTKPTHVVLLGGVIGLVSSFAIHAIIALYSPTDSNSAVSSSNGTMRTQSVEFDASSEFTTPRMRIRNLQELSRLPSKFTQEVALHNFLLQQDTNALVKLFKESKTIENGTRDQSENIQKTILQRLTEITPSKALELLQGFTRSQQRIFLESIYNVWAVVDLNSMLQHVQRTDTWEKQIALRSIVFSRENLSERETLNIARRLDSELLVTLLISERHVHVTDQNTQELWQYLVNDNAPDFLQTELLLDIAAAVDSEHGFDASFEFFDLDMTRADHYYIANTILSEFSNRDPISLFESSTVPTRHGALDLSFSARNAALFEWAKLDPTAAFAAFSEIDLDDVDAKYALESLLDGWAQTDAHGLLEVVDSLPKFGRSYAKYQAAFSIARDDPKIAIDIVNSLKGYTEELERRVYLEILVQVWADKDIDNTLDFVLTDEETEPIRDTLMAGIVRQLTHVDPEHALNIALEYAPVNQPETGTHSLDLIVVETLAQQDVEKAVEWLPRVLKESKLQAVDSIGRAYISGGQPLKAIELRTQLEGVRQSEYIQEILKFWANSQPELLYSNIDELPSRELKSKAAWWLLELNDNADVLTARQIRQTQQFLLDADARR